MDLAPLNVLIKKHCGDSNDFKFIIIQLFTPPAIGMADKKEQILSEFRYIDSQTNNILIIKDNLFKK